MFICSMFSLVSLLFVLGVFCLPCPCKVRQALKHGHWHYLGKTLWIFAACLCACFDGKLWWTLWISFQIFLLGGGGKGGDVQGRWGLGFCWKKKGWGGAYPTRKKVGWGGGCKGTRRVGGGQFSLFGAEVSTSTLYLAREPQLLLWNIAVSDHQIGTGSALKWKKLETSTRAGLCPTRTLTCEASLRLAERSANEPPAHVPPTTTG